PNERVSREQSFRFLPGIGLEADEAARSVVEGPTEVPVDPEPVPVGGGPGRDRTNPPRLRLHRVDVDEPHRHTLLGTLPVAENTTRITLCPASAVGANISGQPPSITVTPCRLPYSVAASETLPPPNERCIQTRSIPRSTHSRIVFSAISGLVPMTTASTPPGIDLRSWKQGSPSTSSAFGFTANTSYPRWRSRW